MSFQKSSPATAPSVAVIGAGIVGVCAALALQRDGCRVTVYDPLPPGGGASFGNAGLISIDSVVPIAMPGMLRNVPRWLTDPQGPLVLRPGYALRAAPWLLRWLRAGRLPAVRASSQALHALHRPSLDEYRRLLGAERFAALLRTEGQIHVWESEREGAGDRLADELRERLAVPTERLDAAALRELLPGISPAIRRGLLFPRHAHTVEPRRLVQAIAELLQQAGGALVAEHAMKIVPQAGGGCRLLTNCGDHLHDGVVVAAGAWSRQLLEPLGVRLPLETERGYHAELRAPSMPLRIPLVHKDRGFAVTPMANGLRIAGTVEIAGLAAPPDERRADTLVAHTQSLFPGLRFERSSAWMGFRPSLPDSLPVIDRLPRHPGVVVACGHGHFGMTAASMTARLVSQLVRGEPPAIDLSPYRLSRF
ncbi:MAG TPA: FAD-binding oxidoreductase [Rubrivivax sp.]|nr:FAD-binding oxidoreductase [Rubrivivax sp.]HRY89413.1 FAD-binding oxidoreductase [Rubrivivax sp.]HRZ61641.1 FAD-binding oxidoreductase [Rubrivivax sp.]